MISIQNQRIYSIPYKRKENQDRCFAITSQSSPHKEQTMGIYVVCDGISHSNGKAAVDFIAGSIYQMAGSLLESLPQLPYGDEKDERGLTQRDLIYGQVAEWILHCDKLLRGKKNHGTTISVSIVFDDCVYTANVGDSPIYLYISSTEETESCLKPLYTCQNEAGKRRLDGILTEQEALRDPSKNHLLHAVGAGTPLHKQDIAFHWDYLGANNLLLMGSDGALAVFSEGKLQELLDNLRKEASGDLRNISMNNVINVVLEQVKLRDYATDNFSLIAVRIDT